MARKDLTDAARKRMAETGESYTEARAAVAEQYEIAEILQRVHSAQILADCLAHLCIWQAEKHDAAAHDLRKLAGYLKADGCNSPGMRAVEAAAVNEEWIIDGAEYKALIAKYQPSITEYPPLSSGQLLDAYGFPETGMHDDRTPEQFLAELARQIEWEETYLTDTATEEQAALIHDGLVPGEPS